MAAPYEDVPVGALMAEFDSLPQPIRQRLADAPELILPETQHDLASAIASNVPLATLCRILDETFGAPRCR